MGSHVFDKVLDLEEQFYHAGYQQGLNDGAHAGKVEGRTFGLEQGFEKYKAMGQLYGQSLIWTDRTPQFHQSTPSDSTEAVPTPLDQLRNQRLPLLPDNPRLAKHITTLLALSESASLSTVNTEDAVTEFNDRLKRAQAKAKIIAKITGEDVHGSNGKAATSKSGKTNIEDANAFDTRV